MFYCPLKSTLLMSRKIVNPSEIEILVISAVMKHLNFDVDMEMLNTIDNETLAIISQVKFNLFVSITIVSTKTTARKYCPRIVYYLSAALFCTETVLRIVFVTKGVFVLIALFVLNTFNNMSLISLFLGNVLFKYHAPKNSKLS